MPQTFIAKTWTSTNKNEMTIQQIQYLHINNTETINSINNKILIHVMNSIITYALLVAAIIIFVYLKYNNPPTIILKPEEIPQASAPSEPATNIIREPIKVTGIRF